MNLRLLFVMCTAAVLLPVQHATAAGAPADDRLAKITTFAFGGVGYAGVISEGEIAFREVWKQSDAARRFRLIFLGSTPEARCYALTALQRLDPVAFKKCAEQFRQNPPEQVQTMSGCLISVVAGLDMLNAIEAGRYLPFLPGKRGKAPEPTPRATSAQVHR